MNKKVRVINATNGAQELVDALCPHCKHTVSFEGVPGKHDIVGQDGTVNYRLGIRKCPRGECRGQLFIQNIGGDLVTFPRVMIDFDNSAIPENISNNFEEALLCEANECFVAAAIMVRKTLEMVCDDRGAKGSNLINRIKDLKNQVTLPSALFDAMDDLRLLGNDAAHIELKDFDNIGKDELDVAIILTKEVLKSIYQLDELVGKLTALKKKQEA